MTRIVNVLGGLGNQMFQFAFATALKAEYPEDEIKINISCFNGYPLHNGFEIERIFPYSNFQHATIKDLFKVAYPWIHYKLWQIGRRILPKRNGMAIDKDYRLDFNFYTVKDKTYFDGYWQAPIYFEKHRDRIKQDFTFPPIKKEDVKNIQALKFIKDNSTAFIHIRRGDYINHPTFGGICTLAYYIKAIQILREQYAFHRFIIFSNDIEWCKKELSNELIDCEILYSDWNQGSESYRDMQLMSKCDAGIVANSSFSWWGAWLSDASLILCPYKWCNINSLNRNIIPHYWHKINY